MAKHIYPCLWFENNAKEAAEFYCKIFPNSKILNESPIVVNFELNGRPFMALNDRRPPNHFSEAVSFVIPCEDQEEIDYYWDQLTSEGGKESMCGWCSDKFGISWQVVPTLLSELMSDPEKSGRVIASFLKMKKFDVEKLKNA
ncbi:MAG: VOC family protein [Chitinophagales bacterium]